MSNSKRFKSRLGNIGYNPDIIKHIICVEGRLAAEDYLHGHCGYRLSTAGVIVAKTKNIMDNNQNGQANL